MPKLEELVDQAFSTSLDADTAKLKGQFAPKESLGEAVKADTSGLVGLDPTNPSNLGRVVSTGLPMVLQMLLTKGGASALPAAPRIGAMGGSGLGALLGYLLQQGKESTPTGALENAALGAVAEGGAQLGGATLRRVTGKSTMLSEGEQAARAAEEALTVKRTEAELSQTAKRADVARAAETGAREGQEAFDVARTGAMQDQVAKRADVAREAGEAAQKAQAGAESKVQTRQALVNQQILKHSDEALANLSQEEVERKVAAALDAPKPLATPTIEQLSERVTPARESVQRNVRSVFKGISQKFEDKLQPFYDTPVQGNFSQAVDSERAILESNKEQVGKKLSGLMDDLAHLDPSAAVNLDRLPPNLKREYELLRRSGKFTPEQLDEHIQKVASGMQGPQASQVAEAFQPPNVKRVDDIRKKLSGVVIGEGTPTERRVANRLIQNIDQNLEGVLPENIRADWTNLRREWHEANAAFSPRFKSMLFNTSTPAEVAEVLYGAGKGKADRVLTVLGKTPKDEMPLLRSAFAERLTQGDVVKNVQGLDKRIFKVLYSGTGFDDPKEWVETLSKGIHLDAVTKNPALYARWNARFQEGLKSFGMKKYEASLAKAEAQLKSTPDPGRAIQDAMAGELTPEQAGEVAMRGKTRPDVGQARAQALAGEETPVQAGDKATAGMERPGAARVRGEMEGMKTPLLGKRMQSYIEHRTAFHTAMAMATLGSIGGEIIHHPIAASVPLAYLGTSKLANMALSNPTLGRLWYRALKSPNLEQAGFWMGRLAAASLTDTVRNAP